MKISVDQFTYHDYPDKKIVVIEKLTPSEMFETLLFLFIRNTLIGVTL